MFTDKLYSLSDEDLLNQYCNTRSQKAFREIYQRYKDLLFRYCAQMAPRHCERIMETLWQSLLEAPPELRRRRLRNWFFVQINRLMSNPDGIAAKCSSDESLRSAFESSEILQAIQNLPRRQRNIFLLFSECGLSLATAADIEKITLAHCRQNLQESRQSIEYSLNGSARKPWKSQSTLAKEAAAAAQVEVGEHGEKIPAEDSTTATSPEAISALRPETTRSFLPWGKTSKLAAGTPASANRSVEVA